MTGKKGKGKISTALIVDQPNFAEKLLAPLRDGKPVVLSVDDLRLPKKTRRYRPVLILTPGESLGIGRQCLLVSFPPYGAELVQVGLDFKATVLQRLGIRFSLAKALADALVKTYFWRV